MAFNGSGVFTLVAGNPVVTGTTISSTWANNTLSDIATGLSTTITKDGQTTPTANIPMGGFKLTNLGAATLNGDALRFQDLTTIAGNVQTQTYTAFTTAGTSTAYTLTTSPAAVALVEDQRYQVEWHTGSGLAPTLARDGLTAKSIKVYDSAGSKVVPPLGSLVAGMKSDVVYDGTDYVVLGQLPPPIPRGYISGLTMANNAGDPTNDIDIASGVCADSTNVYLISLTGPFTKRLDAAWAAGSGNGGLDTGSIGNSDYYIWAIGRTDRTNDDVLFSLSSTAPTMPANYTYKRLIGWFKRVGGAIVAFQTSETAGGGIDMKWTTPTLDVNLANTLTTSRRTDAVKVPLNFAVDAELTVVVSDGTANGFAWIGCPDQTDAAPSLTAAPLYNLFWIVTANASSGQNMRIRTSSTGTVAARANLSTVDLYAIVTLGFTWSRRT